MIRFIMRTRTKDQFNGLEAENLTTLDAAVPDLEARLNAGGVSEYGYSSTDLVGVEVLRTGLDNNAAGDERDKLAAALKELIAAISKVQDWETTRVGDAMEAAEAVLGRLP